MLGKLVLSLCPNGSPGLLAPTFGTALAPATLRRFQLERLGYFCADPDTAAGSLVLNRTCALKESFPKQTSGKVQQKK